MRKRKIVQIAADEGGLVALCDDGTLWLRYKDEWSEIPPPPEPRGVPVPDLDTPDACHKPSRPCFHLRRYQEPLTLEIRCADCGAAVKAPY